jgi:hypothetical protein
MRFGSADRGNSQAAARKKRPSQIEKSIEPMGDDEHEERNAQDPHAIGRVCSCRPSTKVPTCQEVQGD